MEFMDVILNRRSIRAFRPDPIPDDVMEQILEAGRLTPSSMNWQNWRFGVVTDPALKRNLADACGGQEWIGTAPAVLALCAKLIEDLKDRPPDDGWVNAMHLRFGKPLIDYLNAFPDRRAMDIYGDCCDVLLAGHQMLLAAHNFGLRGCWISYMDIARASSLLKLPDDYACLFVIPIGYSAAEPDPIERKSMDEVVFTNTFG